jgi:hypothetical protein
MMHGWVFLLHVDFFFPENILPEVIEKIDFFVDTETTFEFLTHLETKNKDTDATVHKSLYNFFPEGRT